MLKNIMPSFSKLDIHTKEVIKKSVSSSLVKIGGMVFGLGVSIFLGRMLGAEGLGIINLSNRIVSLFLILGLLGMRQVLVKNIAIGYSRKDWQFIGDSMFTTYWLNGGFTLILSLLLILAAPWIANTIFSDSRLIFPLTIALVVMVPQVFSRIFSSGLIGFRKIWQSNLVDQTMSIVIVGILLFIFWLFNYTITINLVALFYGIGRLVVTTSMWFYWKKLFQHKQKNRLIIRVLLKTALPLLIVSITNVITTSSSPILLGWLGNAKQVGLFSVAARLALLTSFFLQVTGSALSPKIAALYANGQKKELEKMVHKITGGLFFIAILSVIIFVTLGSPILSVWGNEFKEAYWILVILSIGQFFNISTGATGITLMMCGKEKILSKIKILELISNLLLNYFLILYYQAVGAAIAIAFNLIFLTILQLIIVKKELNISITKII